MGSERSTAAAVIVLAISIRCCSWFQDIAFTYLAMGGAAQNMSAADILVVWVDEPETKEQRWLRNHRLKIVSALK